MTVKRSFKSVVLSVSKHLICDFKGAFLVSEDYQELIEDIVRDGRLYASENHQEILKVSIFYVFVEKILNINTLNLYC